MIDCGCEAGIDRGARRRETPDERTGIRALLFAALRRNCEAIAEPGRPCVLTSPDSACYTGIDADEERLKLGAAIRFFGDGWQIAKKIGDSAFGACP